MMIEKNSNIKTWHEHTGPLLDSVNDYKVIYCDTCKFIHAIPVPSEEELSGYYSHHFYGVQKPDYFKQHNRDLAWWNKIFNERYALFEKNLQGKGRRILDVGSGPGFFLQFGQKREWETLGVEPSEQACEFSKSLGVDVINGFLDEKMIQDLGKFDVIHSNQVLEHVTQPQVVLDICFQLLNPGGLLFICVANDYNPFQKILKSHLGFKPWWVVPPEHLNYFSVESISHLIESCGFEKLQATTTFPIDLFLLMGENYIGNPEIGKDCHNRRKQLEDNLDQSDNTELKKALYKAFSKLDLGREIEFLARKPLS